MRTTQPASTSTARCPDAVESLIPAIRSGSPAGRTVPSMSRFMSRFGKVERTGAASALPAFVKSRPRSRG
ncbi:hypothetical protein ACE14D_10705 [Streptomyces sp. Act-28]